jgi:hypothetical protein
MPRRLEGKARIAARDSGHLLERPYRSALNLMQSVAQRARFAKPPGVLVVSY